MKIVHQIATALHRKLALFFAGCILLLVAPSCKPPEVTKVEPKPEVAPEDAELKVVVEPVDLPVQRTITDSSGRKIDVTVMGKTNSTIQFERNSDEKVFELPLSSLSQEDQDYFENVNNKNPVKIERERVTDELSRTRIAAIEKEIADTEREKKALDIKIGSQNSSSPRVRGYIRDSKRLTERLNELEAELAEIK